MAFLFRHFSGKLTVRQQSGLILTLGIFSLAAMFSVITLTFTENRLHRQLLEQTRSAIAPLASRTGEALSRQNLEAAREAAQPILAHPSVTGIAIRGADNRLLYRQGFADPAPGTGHTQSEYFQDAEAWHLSFPVDSTEIQDGAAGDPAGSVRVAVGKNALREASHDLLQDTLLTIWIFAVVASVFLLLASSFMVRPLGGARRTERTGGYGTGKATNEPAGNQDRLDSATLSHLQQRTGPRFHQSIEAYLQDIRGHIDSLREAVTAPNRTEVSCLTHLIKSSSSNVGATRLARCCRQLEEESEAPPTRLSTLVENIHREFNEVRHLLTRHLTDQAANLPAPTRLDLQSQILIVDDDNSSRIIMRGILEKDGYRISEAANGLEAVEICKTSMPDLVLLDALMPVMDGFAACERILSMKADRHPSILMITALRDEGTLEQAVKAGATDFIQKPVSLTVLRQRVARMLRAGKVDRHIHQLSLYDHLTALPNRQLFIEQGMKLLNNARRRRATAAVFFMDLDRFKVVNELQGHDAGDLLLTTFAQRVESTTRSTDLLSRLSGDEFTLIASDLRSRKEAMTRARHILAAMKAPFTFLEQQIHVSVSVGIALFPDNGQTIGELMRHADAAMSRAKAKGGNCFELYQAGMEREVTWQLELENEIRKGLDRNQFVLHYQPQVAFASGRLTGVEALIRWHHPERGLLPPGEFIPVAEKSDLIAEIGDWVMRRACQQIRSWLDAGFDPVPVAVNVSGGELDDSVLLIKVTRCLEETGIPPELLKLEITENTLASGSDYVTAHLQELRNLGITLAIDDFGTGYSSLSYLKLFPVDTLKIDRSFIKDLPGDANSAAIVSGIIALGHSLKLTLIAEGVETPEQSAFLRREGCDILQGYLLSKPVPAEDLESWIEHKRHPQAADPVTAFER